MLIDNGGIDCNSLGDFCGVFKALGLAELQKMQGFFWVVMSKGEGLVIPPGYFVLEHGVEPFLGLHENSSACFSLSLSKNQFDKIDLGTHDNLIKFCERGGVKFEMIRAMLQRAKSYVSFMKEQASSTNLHEPILSAASTLQQTSEQTLEHFGANLGAFRSKLFEYFVAVLQQAPCSKLQSKPWSIPEQTLEHFGANCLSIL